MPYQTTRIVASAPALQNVNLTQVGGAGITLGQKLMAASVPVVIASDQSAISTSRTWTLSSATDSATVIGSLSHNDASPSPLSNLGVLPAVASAAAPVYLAGVQVLLSTDLAGALRITGTVTANQGGAPWSQNLTQVGGAALTLGQKVMASSVPVVVASDQSPIAVTGSFSASTSADVFSGPFVSFPTQVPGDAAYFAGQTGKNLTQTPSGRLRVDTQESDEFNNRLSKSDEDSWRRDLLDEMRAIRIGIQALLEYANPASGHPTQPTVQGIKIPILGAGGNDYGNEIDLLVAAQSFRDDASEALN